MLESKGSDTIAQLQCQNNSEPVPLAGSFLAFIEADHENYRAKAEEVEASRTAQIFDFAAQSDRSKLKDILAAYQKQAKCDANELLLGASEGLLTRRGSTEVDDTRLWDSFALSPSPVCHDGRAHDCGWGVTTAQASKGVRCLAKHLP